MDVSDGRRVAAEAGRRARSLAEHPVLERLARLGFVMNGVLHLVIAGIALRLATGQGRGQNADQSGALAAMRATPFGAALLWATAVGVAALALWLLVQAILPAFTSDAGERAKYGAKGLAYLTVAVGAFDVATGDHDPGSSEQQAQDLTAMLMGLPAGRLLAGVVGLGIIGFGVYYAHRGWSRRFTENLQSRPGEWPVRMGVAGYLAKGLALAIVGVLVALAAVTHDVRRSQGLDGALTALRDQPLGALLLGIVALGFACYGIWCFFRARHEDL